MLHSEAAKVIESSAYASGRPTAAIRMPATAGPATEVVLP